MGKNEPKWHVQTTLDIPGWAPVWIGVTEDGTVHIRDSHLVMVEVHFSESSDKKQRYWDPGSGLDNKGIMNVLVDTRQTQSGLVIVGGEDVGSNVSGFDQHRLEVQLTADKKHPFTIRHLEPLKWLKRTS